MGSFYEGLIELSRERDEAIQAKGELIGVFPAALKMLEHLKHSKGQNALFEIGERSLASVAIAGASEDSFDGESDEVGVQLHQNFVVLWARTKHRDMLDIRERCLELSGGECR